MEAFVTTFFSVLMIELTDRTRLIALLLSVRYRAPWSLISGMTLGYIPAIAVAVWGANFITAFLSPQLLKWIIVISFFGFGAYLLIIREDDDEENKSFQRFEHLGPFWLGFILVAVTEFADKSQIATAGFALNYQANWPVFWGSLSAQAILNVIYVGFGSYLGKRLPVRLIRRSAGILFLALGLWALFSR